VTACDLIPRRVLSLVAYKRFAILETVF